MTQRRTPSGQGPARRPGQPGRGGTRGAVRGSRVEPRAAAGRTPASGRSADAVRSASRPAAARRAAAGGAAKRTSAPQPRRFTGRATVLIAVLVTLALGYTYPVRLYLSQQSEIARMEAAQEAQRQKIGELTEEAAKWKDDEYVRIQARKRFYMVYPGEMPMVVLSDPEGAARDAGIDPAAARTQPPEPWRDTLWSSIQAANTERPNG
ncbi:Cell division protein FtsB [Micromonospora pattaloongensis]|uniref:Cell division protein FtsB n=1 Tax=Micromonospora pattaloongensis TaxID=405436 RepID=A0A1H3MD68_9ACTN|nr:septum formation initiator family protein [Micromonospora pattaloongensis]SDY73965.1 Cell division protein FtsB [Micromonospora pattaloongensis]